MNRRVVSSELGGIVHPPVYSGAGGEHAGTFDYSFSYDVTLAANLTFQLLAMLEKQGFQNAIFLTGHYPNRTGFLQSCAKEYAQNGGAMRVLAMQDTQVPGHTKGCHAGVLESSLMLYLHPETMEMTAIENDAFSDWVPEDERGCWMSDEDRDHPCYGIAGTGPRGGRATAAIGKKNTELLIAFLKRWLNGELEMNDDGWTFREC